MKVTMRIPTREVRTWITVAEALSLAVLLFVAPRTSLRLVLGLPLLVHLAWSAMTSLPLGEIPGPPEGVGERRDNHELRLRVVAFLNEVQRVEKYVKQAKVSGVPVEQVEEALRSAEKRIRTAGAEVAKTAGRNHISAG